MSDDALRNAFASHPREWRTAHYVYPVIARRSRGLSIGVNLNPDGACNFDCVYCCVDRTGTRPGARVDLERLESELRTLIEMRDAIFDEPEFRDIPAAYRRLNDIAFSGDGEPTAVPSFTKAADIVVRVKRECGLKGVKIVVITDACYLKRPHVVEALALLDQNDGEIWAKLDAGTDAWFRKVNRSNVPLQFVLENIVSAAKIRPVVIQAMFLRLHDEPPSAAEIRTWADRLSWIVAQGGQIKLVQVYTVARRTTESFVSPLTVEELDAIAGAARAAGLTAEIYA